MKNYDIVIIGGALSGSSIALQIMSGLAANKKKIKSLNTNPHLSIAIIEKNNYKSTGKSTFDDRCIALSKGSQEIYQSSGVWKSLAETDYEAIKHIHVSETGKFGISRLDHSDYDVDAFGYVVESRALGMVLHQKINRHKHIDFISPASVESLSINEDLLDIKLKFMSGSGTQNEEQITAKLLVAADGDQSYCHQFLNTEPKRKSYQQVAIICNIETQFPHQNKAFERFTSSGPIAILPLSKNRCSLVWTVNERDLQQVLNYDDQQFIENLQQLASFRLGKITKVGKRSSYPLSIMSLDTESVELLERMTFIGNAAHAIHPVAGQGFNLGLRDIDYLAFLINESLIENEGEFIYSKSLLMEYWQNRESDIKTVGNMTNSLIKLFSNNLFLLNSTRNIGLAALDVLPPVKKLVVDRAMGRVMNKSKKVKQH